MLIFILFTPLFALNPVNFSKSNKSHVILDTYFNELSDYRYSLITRYEKARPNQFFVDAKVSNSTILTASFFDSPQHPKSVNINENVIVINQGKIYHYKYSSPSNITIMTTRIDLASPIEVIGEQFVVCVGGAISIFQSNGQLENKTDIECGEYLSHGHDIFAIKKGIKTRLYKIPQLNIIYSYSINNKSPTAYHDPMVLNIFDVAYTAITSNNVIEVRSPNDYKSVEYLNIPFYHPNDVLFNSSQTNILQTYGSIIVIGLFGHDNGSGAVEMYYDNYAVLHKHHIRFTKIGRIANGEHYDFKGYTNTLDGEEVLVGGMYSNIINHPYGIDVRGSLKKYCNQNDCTCPNGYYLNEDTWKCYIVIDIGSIIIIQLISVLIFITSMILLVIIYRGWALASPAIPPLITPSWLTFGFNEEAPVHTQIEETLTITNASDTLMECKVELPISYRISYCAKPQYIEIKPHASQKVRICITIECSCQPNEGIVISTGESAVRIPLVIKTVDDYVIDSEILTEQRIRCQSCIGVFRDCIFKSQNKESGVVLALPLEPALHESSINHIKSLIVESQYLCSPHKIALSPNALILVYNTFYSTINELDQNNELLIIKVCCDVIEGLVELKKKGIVFKQLCQHNIIVVSTDLKQVCGKLIGWELPYHLFPPSLHPCYQSYSKECKDEGNEDIKAFGNVLSQLLDKSNERIHKICEECIECTDTIKLENIKDKLVLYLNQVQQTRTNQNIIYS
ncbi:hypothetical protein EDI_284130 [Entamoeba dispar SAW760]|uniref:Protein kinase domain-containing protein n=1 Tax=Entamoeba dispar (strain ATCC PRA-260 / SAW760) TaxID=370354 RepID=B0E5F4_ENTDS|nr:uncharacterized protein EDI_284130 [Entamoeba dispar SAW760]EDR30246.1 hypothetical protein EDI_284130 [Entamoeba dispar SAW760]|eukprot:EDR30246.1 hypothetical protein EDI_284130 [Entamoeba dispar SAW760]